MLDPHNFSDRLRRTIALAQEDSHRLGHNFIGTEQLLIGLLGTDGTAQILNEAGVSLEDVLKVFGCQNLGQPPYHDTDHGQVDKCL